MSLENSCTGGKIREFMDWTDRSVGRQSMIYLCRSDPSHFGVRSGIPLFVRNPVMQIQRLFFLSRVILYCRYI